jgi:cysteine synthase A
MVQQKTTAAIQVRTGSVEKDLIMEDNSLIDGSHLERFNDLKHMIGNTPLLRIHYRFKNRLRTIYAKAENLNLTGSIKDRMALHILKQAYRAGNIQPGDTIVEATSGNTGISFSAIGKALGHRVIIYMPDWMSCERQALIRSLGADVALVSHQQGGFLGSIRLTEELADRYSHIFLPKQFSNVANIEAHEQTTAPEIWYQLQGIPVVPDAFVAGVGTGGTIMGVGRFLRRMNPGIKLYPIEPAESPTFSTGHKVGQHRIQGISDEFIPAIVELGSLDKILAVSDGDAILMAQKLAADLGLAVGISSGANFLGAVMAQDELGDDAVVVTVFPDDNKKYLSTDLLKDEPLRDHYLTPEINLRRYQAFRRVCQTCFDFDELKLPVELVRVTYS